MRYLFYSLVLLFVLFICQPVSASTNISGAIVENTIWGSSGSPYILVGNLTVNAGITLTVDAGVEVSAAGGYDLVVSGRLNATDVTFKLAGSHFYYNRTYYSDMIVNSGGILSMSGGSLSTRSSARIDINGAHADFQGVTFINAGGTPPIKYSAGSSGTVDSCQGSWILKTASSIAVTNNSLPYIEISGGTPTVNGNTITNSMPIRLTDPDGSTSGISGNTFAATDPSIYITGNLDGTRTLDFVDDLGRYKFGFLNIQASGILTLTPGVEMLAYNGSDLVVSGRLNASDATIELTGYHSGVDRKYYSDLTINSGILSLSGGSLSTRSSARIDINGAHADFQGVTFINAGGTPPIKYSAGSSGTVDYCSGRCTLYIYSSAVPINHNNFSTGSVSVYGNSTDTYDMENNWWGSIDPAVIETKIYHHPDDSNRPWVDYMPFLTEPPLAYGTLSNIVVSQRSGYSGLVDIYYDLAGTGTFTISVEVSDNGGSTWNITPTTFLAGSDIGPGVTPDDDKHIIWDCKADLPGVIGSNYKIRVIANDGYENK